MSSPWGKVQPLTEAANLEDIMSEQLAHDLQAKEDKRYAEMLRERQNEDDFKLADALSDDVCSSDMEIAKMLQRQFDKEHDEMLKRTEDKYNGQSKVSVSYSNYRSAVSDPTSDSEEEEIEDIMDRKDWDRFDTVERVVALMPRCGYMKHEGNVVTKHDITIAGRKNACKFMSFPPEFQTGDGAGFDLQLSNKVFNSLKVHSRHEQARRHRIHDKKEDQATAELGVDEFTRLLLYKLINNQLLEKVNGVISTGKEAVIIHADSDPSYPECTLPKECVVKVFKTVLSEFKQREKYIKDDYRFKDRYGKQNARKTVMLWAEKEMHNLTRLHKIGLPCPQVVALKKHVLVMSFIGEDHRPAPKLKDVVLSLADFILAYEQVVEAMKKMYSEAKLIHADLSEYNILYHDNKCWFIDVSQSVEPGHPNAYNFLFRDCTNVTSFFNKRGVPEVQTPEELFTAITGYDYNNKKLLLSMQTSTKMKPHLAHRDDIHRPDNFDNAWEQSKRTVKVENVLNEVEGIPLVEFPLA